MSIILIMRYYRKADTKWQEVAFNRMANHDLYPEKVDNR